MSVESRRIQLKENDEFFRNMPQNPLMEKWLKEYPPVSMPNESTVCDGYSCMWCSRCPYGDNWACPEEDREEYDKYLEELKLYLSKGQVN